MSRVKRNIFIIIGVLFFIFIYPIIINLVVQSPGILGIEFSSNSTWIGYYSTFHGAIFGGIISGAFTFFGVRLTLINQFKKDKNDKENKRKRLYTQLKFSYDMIFGALSMEDGSFSLDFIVYENNWSDLIIEFPELSFSEFRSVVNWFYVMHKIEIASKANGGGIALPFIKEMTKNSLEDIEKIILIIEEK